ncbi:MAG: ribulose-phosphate 3-epimerase [Acidobacteriota bacterium]
MKPLIVPSILAADFANLERSIRAVEEAGAEMIHVDVMDGHFVPNLTVGLPVVRRLREITELALDVHLMLTNPEEMAVRFVEAGANCVSVHYEACRHLEQVLRDVRGAGARPGVVLNPHSPVHLLEEILPYADYVLLMSVNPGFGGQELLPTAFQKVRKLKNLIRSGSLDVLIEIDGGIEPENVAEAVEAGVDWIVAGTAVFGGGDPKVGFRRLRERLAGVRLHAEER